MMIKKLLSFLLLTCLLLFGIHSEVKATHAAGAEITYEWISGSTYKIIYTFYRSCAPGATTEPTTVSCCYYATCGGPSYTVTLTKIPGVNGTEVGTGCPGYPSQCSGGTNPGYREWKYSGTVTLPSQCNFWRFYVSVNARNNAITNLTNPGGTELYVETTFDNQAAQGNSSPYFTVKPISYMCINSPYTFNNGAVDPNGDSLSYEQIMPMGAAGTTGCAAGAVAPNTNFNQPVGNPTFFNLTNNPLSTNNTYNLNASTGSVTFTPNAQQIAVIAIRVKEWRNGQLIGSIVRDMQYVVLNCTSVPPNFATDTTTLTGVQMVNGQVQGCANQPFNFCFNINSSNPAAVLVASANNATIATGSTITYTGAGTANVQGCFSWNPTAADTGLKVLSVTVKDSTCTPPGILLAQTFTIPLYVWGPTIAGPDTAICSIDSIQLWAKGGLTYSWSVLPGGSPITSLSCINCKNPIVTPTVSTKYVVTSTSGNNICNKHIDTVDVQVLPPPNFTLGPDVTTCKGDSMQLNVNLTAAPNTTYQVTWFPSTWLSSDTILNPIIKPLRDTTYVVTIVPNGVGQCGGRDTLNVNVLQGFTIYNNDTAICKGQSVQIQGLGETEYLYTWQPLIGVGNPSIINPLITPDTSRLYTITASYPGCTDSVQQIFIDVQPIPNVFVGADKTLCLGDTVHLQGQVNPSSYPFYTYSWTPAGGLNIPNIINPIFTALNTTNLTLTVKTPAGCTGSDDAKFTVIKSNFINISADTAICPRDTANIRALGGSISTVIWSPNIYIKDSTLGNNKVWPVTSTTYTVIARDTNFCLDTAVVTVEVKPQAVVYLPDSVRIYPGDSYQMDPGGNGLYFQWFPPAGLSATNVANPIATPNVNTRYFVRAFTEFGCPSIDSIDVMVSYDSYLDVPNAFTPGNNANSTAHIVHLGNATLKTFAIFNRWGQKVFETSDINEGWDGTFGGKPQPMGVYVYIVEAVTPTGRKFVKQGNITLIR